MNLNYFIENTFKSLCHERRILFSSKSFFNELESYKWLAGEIKSLGATVLYRDEGSFKKEYDHKIKGYFHSNKIKIVTEKKDKNAKIAQLIGIVDYILHCEINIPFHTKIKKP